MADQPVLLLCSASPRRRAYLESLGLRFEVCPADLDEARLPGERPEQLAARLARQKASAGLRKFRERSLAPAVALAADTVVALGDEDFAKPVDHQDAARMLRALSGKPHTVLSGVATATSAGERVVVVRTEVRFQELSEAQIGWLAATGDGDGKAGAYAIQGLGGLFIDRLEGSVTNVVGLPMAETIELLRQAGVRLPWEQR